MKTVSRTTPPGFEGEDPDVIDARVLSARYPRKAVDEYEQAIENTEKGQIDQAIERLQRAVTLAPDFYHAFNNLGVALQRQDRYRDAEKAFLRAMELSPNSQQPILNLGILRVQEAEYRRSEGGDTYRDLLEEAVVILDRAIEITANTASAHYYLGATHYRLDLLDRAEHHLLRARELDKSFGPVLLMLSNVYVKQGRWELVLAQLDAYLREHPDAPDREAIIEVRSRILQQRGSP
jgi:tetratricopeptide (TPR) repeat protein